MERLTVCASALTESQTGEERAFALLGYECPLDSIPELAVEHSEIKAEIL